MKQFITLSFFLFFTIALYAQPANDDCPSLNLGDAPVCPDSVLFNNVGATESNIGFDNFPPCFVGNPDRDVWFSFVAVDTILDYRVLLTGMADPANGHLPIVNPQIAVYRGDCEFDGMQLLDCVSATAGETEVMIDLVGLTPGITYFLRINDWSPTASPNSGAFKLCITKKPPIITIDQGSSNACSGTLCDTGGPDGDYGNNENHVFTICPSTPHNCIIFTLEYFAIENFSDVLTFYDGPNTNSPVIATLDGSGFGNEINGGVCYEVLASSGCLTVAFTSDAAATYEGFCGAWQCTQEACDPNDNILVDASASPEEIVQSVVAGETVITVTDINCANGSVGTFLAGDNTDLGLDQGLLLTSGQASEAAGVGTFFASSGNGMPGDADLDYLSTINGNGTLSQDACVVELEVFAATDEITFEYIFGSEEYPEFVNTSFNDIFAFLVAGPGITGDPNIGNQENIATLPDGTFIQINSVNGTSNWQFYRNNENGTSVVYDGLTSDSLGVKKSLTAKIATIPCNTYTLKLAIADRGDSAYDSGVFISEIKGGSPNLEVVYNNGINYLVEECSAVPDDIIVSLNTNVDQPTTYNVVVGGTAELGVDYELNIPSTLTFTPTQTEFTFPITALADGIPEGIDTVEIKLTRDFGCGEVVLATLIIEIHDNLLVQIFDDAIDTVLVCQGSCVQMDVTGAADYFWQPPGLFDDPQIPNPTACPDTSRWVAVTGTLGICTDMDSVFLQLIDPQVNILPGDFLTICEGDSITITAENNVDDSNLLWQTFFLTLPDPTNPVQTIVPPPFFNSIFLNVSVELGGCVATDEVTINIDAFDFPQVAADTTICQNFSVDLGEDIPNTTTSYSWTPGTWLSPGGNVSGPIATPDVTTTYTLIGTSPTGVCADTASVTVTVIPADVEIQNPDTTYLCLGDSVTITSITSTNGAGVTWTPQDYMTINDPEEVVVYPPVTTWYYSTLETGACTVIDSVLVYVDSLPDLSITAVPDKPSYCQGEEVTLISPTYEPSHFPGIDLNWVTPLPGALTPDSFLNLVFLAVETHTFVRETTVHACSSTDSINIVVIPVASLEVVPALDTICPGESVQFSIIADPGVSGFMWSPPDGLSCTDCDNPLASPGATTTYSVDAEFAGCPVGGSATLLVQPLPQYQFPFDRNICPGEQVTLNAVNDPTATYLWTSSDNSLNSTEAQPVVTPTQTTTYFLQASNGFCDISDEVTIALHEDFNLSVTADTTLCQGEPVQLVANVDKPGVKFSWTDANGTLLSTESELTVAPNETTTYFISTQDSSNPPCFLHNDSVTVTVIPSIVITDLEANEVTSDTLDLFEGEEFIISASTIPDPIPGGVFDWFVQGELITTTNDTSSGVLNAPEVDADQLFTYALLVTNEFGCTAFKEIGILVKNNPVDVPNAFSPNGDELNQNFTLVSKVPVNIIDFKVYNRWGQLVYNNKRGQQGWDGKQNGTPAPADVYIYYIKYEMAGGNGKQYVLKGDVTLLR
ncbi:MAG: choice-of-anchor L domain-containing protein [Saprospiraceae bacterium]